MGVTGTGLGEGGRVDADPDGSASSEPAVGPGAAPGSATLVRRCPLVGETALASVVFPVAGAAGRPRPPALPAARTDWSGVTVGAVLPESAFGRDRDREPPASGTIGAAGLAAVLAVCPRVRRVRSAEMDGPFAGGTVGRGGSTVRVAGPAAPRRRPTGAAVAG